MHSLISDHYPIKWVDYAHLFVSSQASETAKEDSQYFLQLINNNINYNNDCVIEMIIA